MKIYTWALTKHLTIQWYLGDRNVTLGFITLPNKSINALLCTIALLGARV